MICNVCKSLAGEKMFSPGPIIYTGRYWIVDHAYPTSVLGWLVIVLKRHVESLHELTALEWEELQTLQKKTIKILHTMFLSKKEYVGCFSETETHLHIHVIAKPKRLKDELRGYRIFTLLNADERSALAKEEINKLSKKLKKEFD